MPSILSILLALCLFATLFTAQASPIAMHGAAAAHHLEKRGHAGKATYFHVGLGACGKHSKDTDLMLAISSKLWNKGKHCGKKVTIKNPKTGKSVTGTVLDECPDCGSNDLDLSPAVFKKLGNMRDGVLKVTWTM